MYTQYIHTSTTVPLGLCKKTPQMFFFSKLESLVLDHRISDFDILAVELREEVDKTVMMNRVLRLDMQVISS